MTCVTSFDRGIAALLLISWSFVAREFVARIRELVATGETLRQLVASHTSRNDEAFRAAVLRLIAEEQQRQHHALARELERLLSVESETHPGMQVGRQFQELPRDRERQTLLLEVRTPHRYLSEVVLDEETRQALQEAIEEYQNEDVLRSYGLKPKNRLLFFGPPGCGKTLCAEIFATELGLPLLYTRFDGLVSSFLGETAANLRRVFEYAARGTWVLFFDEFDAIGKSRDELGESGELKRVVNSFLQILDSFQSPSYFVAATNHETLLDNALWRRFDDILYFGPPNRQQAMELIRQKLSGYPHPKVNISRLADQVQGFSYADIEHVCTEAIKRCILSGMKELDNATLKSTLIRHRHRVSRFTTHHAEAPGAPAPTVSAVE